MEQHYKRAKEIFLAVCDLLARRILAPADLPVGVLTAIIGGPFFLWILLRKEFGRQT